jgi:cellulose synthase/poly-beta-1,6-N-acetylglucosamine synthase-like glycosyltransferase
MLHTILLLLCVLLTLFYVSLILAYFFAWIRIPYYQVNNTVTSNTYSIIVPARNEAANLFQCIQSIASQKTSVVFEILIINDCSTDTTEDIAHSAATQFTHCNIKVLNMNNITETGKKAAITYGAQQANGNYLILTDADCTRSELWLETIDSFVQDTSSKMVYAPVLFKAQTVFEKIQALEFAGLVAIGGAAIELNNPNMCSGSNLVVSKQAFFDVDGYKGSEHIATGDDEYLLHKICKFYPQQVHFLKHKDAIVTTTANKTLSELASQRKRWVSASTQYENIYITAILIAAYLFNASIVYMLFTHTFVGLTMLLIKSCVECLFLHSVLRFFNKKSYLYFFPIAQPFHIVYVLFIGLWGNMGQYNWKGRTVR